MKQHIFFKDIIWDTIYYKTMEAPFIVGTTDKYDTSNFEKFTELPLKKSSRNLYAAEFARIEARPDAVTFE